MLLLELREPGAPAPSFGSDGAAGMDLFACEPKEIWPSQRAMIKTGIAMAIPKDHVGLIWPRSGMAVRQGVDVLAGVIDSDYRGTIQVALINHGPMKVNVESGDRIAQMLIQPVVRTTVTVVSSLSETSRGNAGFGSTGK